MSRVVAIVGSRSYPDLEAVRRFVRDLPSGTVVMSGGANGVDHAAETEAARIGFKVVSVRPKYETHGPRAPLIRNAQIAKMCDEMVAFWQGESTGTMHAVSCARRLGKPVRVIDYRTLAGGPDETR